MKWIVFFSQTGSEIVELSKSIGRKPDLLVTNNFEEKIKNYEEIIYGKNLINNNNNNI